MRMPGYGVLCVDGYWTITDLSTSSIIETGLTANECLLKLGWLLSSLSSQAKSYSVPKDKVWIPTKEYAYDSMGEKVWIPAEGGGGGGDRGEGGGRAEEKVNSSQPQTQSSPPINPPKQVRERPQVPCPQCHRLTKPWEEEKCWWCQKDLTDLRVAGFGEPTATQELVQCGKPLLGKVTVKYIPKVLE